MEDIKSPIAEAEQPGVEIFATPKAYEMIMNSDSPTTRMVIKAAQSYSFGEDVKSDYVVFMHAREFVLHCRRAESPSEKHTVIIAEREKFGGAEFDELLKESLPVSFV